MDKATLHENRVHGDSMFQFDIYKVDYIHNGAIFDYHWHYELEIIYLKQGEATVQVGTSVYHVKQGEALFIPSEELHAAYPINNIPFTLYAIVFHSNLISSSSFDLIQQKYIEIIQRPDSPIHPFLKGNDRYELTIIEKIESVISIFSSKEMAFELLIKSELMHILASLVQRNGPTVESETSLAERQKIARLKTVLAYINENYHHKLQIADLASLVQMSEGHFSRFFKELVHKTPIEYINSIRLHEAAKLLVETDRKIVDIAMEVGFDNQSYFIRAFKKQNLCTPKEFRKKR
ncbi:AraC family transcriptional regulator [Bacillus alkalicellulosilyticus]|uniref:AraC family transcriptional regulator n=1 Tax=Alkalihalobacterium alkalicellulosilyticum TaxID=1912214 RepID=UPI00099705FD|nr:AraC family transcriptional regulator [Bacillus alkalicellulosilyticus]